MATLECHTTSSDGVTLVELVVTSDTRERVRVENCLDGPVWPPRRQGVPEDGWTDSGYEGDVGPDDRLVAGYATPADPSDPPARLVSVDSTDDDSAVTPRDVVRALGDPRPPREGVAVPDESHEPPPSAKSTETGSTEPPEKVGNSPEWGHEHATTEGSLPPAVEAYLTRVRERLDEAEGLAGPSTAGEASDALAAVGGPEAAATMQEQLAADGERLARLGAECERLVARINAVDVPVETLERLA